MIGEEDRGEALLLTVAGERARLGALSRYLVGEAGEVAAAGV